MRKLPCRHVLYHSLCFSDYSSLFGRLPFLLSMFLKVLLTIPTVPRFYNPLTISAAEHSNYLQPILLLYTLPSNWLTHLVWISLKPLKLSAPQTELVTFFQNLFLLACLAQLEVSDESLTRHWRQKAETIFTVLPPCPQLLPLTSLHRLSQDRGEDLSNHPPRRRWRAPEWKFSYVTFLKPLNGFPLPQKLNAQFLTWRLSAPSPSLISCHFPPQTPCSCKTELHVIS